MNNLLFNELRIVQCSKLTVLEQAMLKSNHLLENFVVALDSVEFHQNSYQPQELLHKERYIKLQQPHHVSKNVECFCTLRINGVSKEPYDSFNLGLHVGDDKEQVLKNRELVTSELGLNHLFFMDQTHSTDVILIDGNQQDEPPMGYKCDSLVSTLENAGIAVMTADCLPVLLFVPGSPVIAAIHCGWRGLVNGILENTISVIHQLGIDPAMIMMTMGPAIGPNSYEVGAEIYKDVVAQNLEYSSAFVARDLNETDGVQKYYFDLYKLAFIRYVHATEKFITPFMQKLSSSSISLHNNELNKIEQILRDARDSTKTKLPCFDTLKQNNFFYSYRASKETGRLASIIVSR